MSPSDDLMASADTNPTWESMLTRDLAEDILGHAITAEKWENMIDALEDAVFDTVMAFAHD